jgi:preprotein translocase subunit YajC
VRIQTGLLAHAVPAAAGSNGKSGGSYGFLIVLALLAVAFYLFVLRPQRTRVRRTQAQQRELAIGSQVMTSTGLYGTVAAIEDDAVLLEIAPGVTTRWARAAIGRVVETPEALGLDDHGDAPGSDTTGDTTGDTSGGNREHPSG